MSKKEIAKIAKRFQRRTQKIVNNGQGITSITMQIGDKPPVVIAQKDKDKEK